MSAGGKALDGLTCAGRALLVVLAAVVPLLTAYVGIHRLAAHLAGQQPDGDLEAGGGFALAVLLGELVLLSYVASGLLLAVLWRWVGGSPVRALLVVTGASVVVTGVLVGLTWE